MKFFLFQMIFLIAVLAIRDSRNWAGVIAIALGGIVAHAILKTVANPIAFIVAEIAINGGLVVGLILLRNWWNRDCRQSFRRYLRWAVIIVTILLIVTYLGLPIIAGGR